MVEPQPVLSSDLEISGGQILSLETSICLSPMLVSDHNSNEIMFVEITIKSDTVWLITGHGTREDEDFYNFYARLDAKVKIE